ncbi:hypothetical protein BC829DRAFT_401054 [Chytridium lagenaria]|nr:hypothetical protein BC829DRAFT_401054 [Chytridium lagenaria]
MINLCVIKSRKFGFVSFYELDSANAAVDGMNGAEIDGRPIKVEKAKRAGARNPTPGKYHGPPKREDRFVDRYDDRRGDRYDRRDRYDGRDRDRNDDRRYERRDRDRYDDRRRDYDRR